MATARRPAVLKAVYHETLRAIRAYQIPTQLIVRRTSMYRALDASLFTASLQGIFPRQQANLCLAPADQHQDRNRFSGLSLNGGILSWGGLYGSTQNQTVSDGALHPPNFENCGNTATELPAPAQNAQHPAIGFLRSDLPLKPKLIVKIGVTGAMSVADLAFDNAGTRQFIGQLECADSVQAALRFSLSPSVPLWDQLLDAHDCSVARGIGLAVANSGSLRGLILPRSLPSALAVEETGDNIVWYGHDGRPVSGLRVEEAYVFPVQGRVGGLRVET